MNDAERSRSGSGTSPLRQRFGQYELIRRIAAGGMAEIFLAKQTGISGFERLLVIKRILPHLAENKEFITMFLDEARIAAQLTHPNVVQIYDLGRLPSNDAASRAQDSYYIAMEYLHGEDVRKIYNQELAREARIPYEYACHIIAQASAGLDYAHRKVDIGGQPLGLVHRDISPQNLLVAYDGHVKIVDFGVAKAANKMAQTRSGALKGKYSYMSPEQAQGSKIDARTDIFALAIVLYEITCCVRLFKRENELETLHSVIACEVMPPSKIDPGFPPALERIIMKALSKNPSRRQQTSGEFARDLDDYCQSIGKSLTAREVAGYMQDLFADKLAEELLVGHGMWEEEHTDDRMKDEQKSDLASGGTHLLDEEDNRHELTRNERGSKPTSRSGTRDTRADEGGPDFDMSFSTDATAPAKKFEQLEDSPETVMLPTETERRSSQSPNEKRATLWVVHAASGLLVLLFILALLAVFDAADKSGPIAFTSRPTGASIYLDGTRLGEGKTPPILSRQVALGVHRVKYQLDGYETAEGDLQVTAGAPSTFELDLKPVVPAPTPEARRARVNRAERARETAPEQRPAKAVVQAMHEAQKAPGALSVKSRVPLKIFSGKTLLGTTPLQTPLPPGRQTIRLELPVGTYTVKLWNSDLGKQESAEVRIVDGKEAALERNWRK